MSAIPHVFLAYGSETWLYHLDVHIALSCHELHYFGWWKYYNYANFEIIKIMQHLENNYANFEIIKNYAKFA